MNQYKIEQISLCAISVLSTRFVTFPANANANRNAPFHHTFLQAFNDQLKGRIINIPDFIALSSWSHGLSTSMGQTFFEGTSHILSGGKKKSFTKKDGTALRITTTQSATISSIMNELQKGSRQPNVAEETRLISNKGDERSVIEARDFTVDDFIETNTMVQAIELKSVRPNLGELRGEKSKTLEAKAALMDHYPGKTILYFLGFPFDPTSTTLLGMDKQRFLHSIIGGQSFYALDEILLGEEFWDRLSGEQQTMPAILDIISNIATVDFPIKMEFINNLENRVKEFKKYRELLTQWNLFRELGLISNQELLIRKVNGDQRGIKYINAPIFKDGKYDEVRFQYLNNLLSK